MTADQNRIVYLDNIRSFVVFNVVIGHVMMIFAYPFSFWWSVVDQAGSSGFYETAVISMLVYGMPCLLFISTLFIFPSLNKGTALGYLKRRFLRLYVPVLAFLFCAGDIPSHLCLQRLNAVSPSYLDTFLNFWRSFSDIPLIHTPDVIKTVNSVWFNFSHTWFLTLLFFLTLFVVFLSRPFNGKFRGNKDIDSPKIIISKTILFAVALGIFNVAAVVFLVKHGIGGTVVLIVGKAVQVPIHQFCVLLPLFLFGFYVHKRRWLTRGDIGNWKLWAVMACVSMALYALLFHNIVLPVLNEMVAIAEHNILSANEAAMPAIDRSFLIGAASTFFLSPLACVFMLMFLLSFTKRFFNKPNVITTFCAKHSINVYVLHYVLVFILGHMFLSIPIYPIAKIILISIIIVLACLWISHRLVYPHPKIAIAFFVVLKLIALAAGFRFYYYATLTLVFISFFAAIFESARWYMVSREAHAGSLGADA